MSVWSHAQLQLLYEKYRQLVRLQELAAEAPYVAQYLTPTEAEIKKVRKVCPQSFVLKLIDARNKS